MSETSREANLRYFLRSVGLTQDQVERAVRLTLGEEPAPKPTPRERRCGASLPHPDAAKGWRWCGLSSGHTEPHMDVEDNLFAWEDGTEIEVTSVELVRAVPDHTHAFAISQKTCVRFEGCQLTWEQHRERGNGS